MNRHTSRRALMTAAGALALGSLVVLAPAKAKQPKTPRVIKVLAKKFEFVPGEIHVKQGETVTLQFTAPEVPMGFNLPDFKVRTDILPDKVSRVRFVPDKAGTFDFVCDIFCGSGHESMEGTIVVT